MSKEPNVVQAYKAFNVYSFRKFKIEEIHLKLIQRMYFSHINGYYETGGACVPEKRPYGNSDVEFDVAEIMGELPSAYYDGGDEEDEEDEEDEDEDEISDEKRVKFARIHAEATVALQICTHRMNFETGYFIRDSGCIKTWVKTDKEGYEAQPDNDMDYWAAERAKKE